MIALSTAFKRALIGISIDDQKETFEIDANCKHSENILLSIDGLLNKMNKNFSQNNSFGVVIGPGSFTGIRICTALVKGFLGGGAKANVVTLTSFELMAYTYINKYKPKENFVCAIDALSGLCFVCEFDKDGKKISAEKMITIEEFQKETKCTVGLAEETLNCKIKITPTAEQLLELCCQKESIGKLSKEEDILPVYLRKSQAEASYEERLKKS